MPIAVICPGCRAQFRVSDKFAGKQGACPKCKTLIIVPLAEEVKIHAPDEAESAAGKKGALGAPNLKPVSRKKWQFQPVYAAAIGAGAVTVLAIAWLAGDWIRDLAVLRVAGIVALSLPLVVGAYAILRDDELEPYRGTPLWIRASICAAVYAATWGVFALLPAFLLDNNWNWLFVGPPFLAAGTLAAYASLDLAPESAFFHYAFYLLATLLLRAAIGLPALWNLGPPATA